MRPSSCFVVLGVLVTAIFGKEKDEEQIVDAIERGNARNPDEDDKGLKVLRTSDAIVSLAKFGDLLDADEDIMDITRSDTLHDGDFNDVGSTGNESAVGFGNPILSKNLQDVGLTKTTIKRVTKTNHIHSGGTLPTTTIASTTSVDDFDEFGDLDSFNDISSRNETFEPQEMDDFVPSTTTSTTTTTTTLSPPTDGAQWTVIPSESTVLSETTMSSKAVGNVVRYFVKITRAPNAALSTTPPPTTTTTTRTTTITTTTASPPAVSMEPTMTIPTPEEESSESFSNENEDHPDVETITAEEEGNNRIERSGTVADLSNRTDTEDVVDFSAAANETSTSDPDPEPAQTPEAITIPVTTEGNFLISKYNHLLSLRAGHTILPLSTSSFSYSSMLPPRPLGGFQEMHTEPAKPTSKRPRSSSSMESSSSEQIPATVPTTTLEAETNATESNESPTTAELPTTIQLETPPVENEGFPDVTDFDLMEEPPTSDQTTVDKSRYTTLTVDRIDQDMDTDQEPTKSTRTPLNDSQTTPDELWWTPLPKYLENDTSTPSPKLPTKTPHEKKAQTPTKSGMKKVEKMDTPVPLARASAVGQFSYTTTVVPEFATLNEDLDDLDQTTVPELHLQQLSSELAFLGSSEVKRYVAEPPPAPLRLRYGKPKRRIAISRKKNNTKGKMTGRSIITIYPVEKTRAPTQKASYRKKASNHNQPKAHRRLPGKSRITKKLLFTNAKGAVNVSPRNKGRLQRRGPGSSVAMPPSPAWNRKPTLIRFIAPSEMANIASRNVRGSSLIPNVAKADMNELEDALKEIALHRVSNAENGKNMELVSFTGDYRELKKPVDGHINPRRNYKRVKKPRKGRRNRKHLNRSTKEIHSFPDVPPPPPLDVEVMESVEMNGKSINDIVDSERRKELIHSPTCTRTECSFEKGLCGFMSSESTSAFLPSNHLSKRSLPSTAHFAVKSWKNLVGYHKDTNQRVDQAPIFTRQNRHFAGSLLKSQEVATLTLENIAVEPVVLNFDCWEASREMRFRVCCDDLCPYDNYNNRQRSTRKWRRVTVQCPEPTHVVTFECANFGSRLGACGIDNFSSRSRNCSRRK